MGKYLNRELEWLKFNYRVLDESKDLRNPLLERLRFLSIFNSNLDEFYMKRVGGLKRQQAVGVSKRSLDGQTATEQLKMIRTEILGQQKELAESFRNIRNELRENGIFLLEPDDVSDDDRQRLEEFFLKNIYPVLTPLAVDPGHPFPFISNLSHSLGIVLSPPKSDEKLFARLKIPGVFPGWIRLRGEPIRFIRLRDLIEMNLEKLFPSMEVKSVMAFRVTRNADIERDEEDAEDLLEMIEEELRQRRFADVVRIEHGPNPDSWILDFLAEELEVQPYDFFELEEELDFTDLNVVAGLDIPELKYPVWSPVVPRILQEDGDMFAKIRQGDIFVHHPFESYSASVERFIKDAADDDRVLAIKMTLYRTGDDSETVRSLIRAAGEGKQVVCLIELKARFEEEQNIYWAQELENAGIHVVYGIVGLKTHSKVALVVRREADGLRSYCHIGTGNYNSATARLYTDVGLFTCDPEISSEVVELFHYLTGRSLRSSYENLLVAPVNMSSEFLRLIEVEAENAKNGKPSRIIAKFNSMEDREISEALYLASQAGVQIDLIVRGFCCLKPGVPGLSENIRVTSIIGRFLEHSRIFFFQNGAERPEDGKFFIGSADWMYRNLHRRVEATVPIKDADIRARIWDLLQTLIADTRQSWAMHSSGDYSRKDSQSEQMGSHARLMEEAKASVALEGD